MLGDLVNIVLPGPSDAFLPVLSATFVCAASSLTGEPSTFTELEGSNPVSCVARLPNRAQSLRYLPEDSKTHTNIASSDGRWLVESSAPEILLLRLSTSTFCSHAPLRQHSSLQHQQIHVILAQTATSHTLLRRISKISLPFLCKTTRRWLICSPQASRTADLVGQLHRIPFGPS